MSQKNQQSTDENLTPANEISKWHKQEELLLLDKLLDAKAKPPTIEEKIDNWRSLDEFQKKRKCVKKLKSKFKKPLTLLIKLQDVGQDLVEALDEGLKPTRVERIINAYSKARLKLLEAVREAEHLNESLPEAAHAAGGFPWDYQIPDVFDEHGDLNVLAKDGIRTAHVNHKEV